jgi:hypothetical protein
VRDLFATVANTVLVSSDFRHKLHWPDSRNSDFYKLKNYIYDDEGNIRNKCISNLS